MFYFVCVGYVTRTWSQKPYMYVIRPLVELMISYITNGIHCRKRSQEGGFQMRHRNIRHF